MVSELHQMRDLSLGRVIQRAGAGASDIIERPWLAEDWIFRSDFELLDADKSYVLVNTVIQIKLGQRLMSSLQIWRRSNKPFS